MARAGQPSPLLAAILSTKLSALLFDIIYKHAYSATFALTPAPPLFMALALYNNISGVYTHLHTGSPL